MRPVLRWQKGTGLRPYEPDPVLDAFLARTELFRSAPCVLVLPPFWDHHGHIPMHGALLEQVDLRGCPSLEEALGRVGAGVSAHATSPWLLGLGWDQNLWGGEYPDRRHLDALCPDKPALLRRIDGHAAWVNSAALALAGFDDSTPDPPGGFMVRREGRLSGILVDRAMDVVSALVPPPRAGDLERHILSGLEDLRRWGLCGATDMGLDAAALAVLERLDGEGRLPAAVEGFLHVSGETLAVERFYVGTRFWVAGGKLYADGALGSRGAALTEDYCDAPGLRGVLLRDAGALAHAIQSVLARGLVPAIHAIGDGALGQALHALEACGAPRGARIEHAQVASDEQVRRMARAGVVASVQPCHLLSDRAWAPKRLGPRMAWSYRAGTFASAGVPLLLGTDFPIESPDPVRNLLACLGREDPAEALDLDAALAAYGPPEGRAVPSGRTLLACEGPGFLGRGGGEGEYHLAVWPQDGPRS